MTATKKPAVAGFFSLALPRGLARIAPKRFEGLRPVGANAPPPKTLSRFVEQGPHPSQEIPNQNGPTLWTLFNLALPRGFEPLLPP